MVIILARNAKTVNTLPFSVPYVVLLWKVCTVFILWLAFLLYNNSRKQNFNDRQIQSIHTYQVRLHFYPNNKLCKGSGDNWYTSYIKKGNPTLKCSYASCARYWVHVPIFSQYVIKMRVLVFERLLLCHKQNGAVENCQSKSHAFFHLHVIIKPVQNKYSHWEFSLTMPKYLNIYTSGDWLVLDIQSLPYISTGQYIFISRIVWSSNGIGLYFAPFICIYTRWLSRHICRFETHMSFTRD